MSELTDSTSFAAINYSSLEAFKELEEASAGAPIPVYADDSSAITGGLVVGDIYRLPTGGLKTVMIDES